LAKYGKGKERRTEITTFEKVQRTQVVVNNAKLYANLKEGFVGMGLKKDDFIANCSDIDDVIVFLKNGQFMVARIADKTFIGKDIIHVAVWKKGDERTTYNMAYVDAKTGRALIKRFNVKAITRDKLYDLTTGHKLNKVLYFSANPNGEAEIINVQLSQGAKARIKNFNADFSEIAIKGRASKGNIMTRYGVRKIVFKEAGKSTLGAMKIWMDEVSGRLNKAERGLYLGAFDTGDQILAIYIDGSYELMDLELAKKFEPKDLFFVGRYKSEMVISAIYFDGERKWTMIKRFNIETTSANQKFPFISEHKQSKLYYANIGDGLKVSYNLRTKEGKEEKEVDLISFIDVKGWKSLGNKLEEGKLTAVKVIEQPKEEQAEVPKEISPKLKPGDSIDFDIEGDGQTTMFE